MKHWKKILGLAFSLLFLWLALGSVEWAKIPPILKSARLGFVFLMIANTVLDSVLRGYRWQVIFDRPGISLFTFFSGWMLGGLFNNLFPARAGEFVRCIYLGRKNGLPASEAFGSVVLERFLDGVVVMVFVTVSFSIFPINHAARIGAYTAAAFYGVVFLFLVMMQFGQKWFEAILTFLINPFPEHWQIRIHASRKSFVRGLTLFKSPSHMMKIFGLSFAAWGISLMTTWLGLQVFSLPYGPSEALLLLSFLALGAMIPSSPGMIGIYEYCCVLALVEVLGLQRELAVTFGLFMHMVNYLFVLCVGGGLMFFENLSWKELERQEPMEPSAKTPVQE